MRLDRILLDILDWVRRSLWLKQQGTVKKPYEVLATQVKNCGRIKLVQRDTPRSVRTWIFTPFKNTDNPIINAYETHLCCDFLEPLAGEKRRWGSYSHQISILIASRKLLPDGGYESEELFEGKYKLHQTSNRDFYAIQLMDKLASTLGDRGLIDDYDFEIDAIAKQIMRHDYPGARFKLARLNSVRGIILDPPGFTMTELLITMLLVTILSAIAYPSYLNQRDKALYAEAEAIAASYAVPLNEYKLNHGEYPPDVLQNVAPRGLEGIWVDQAIAPFDSPFDWNFHAKTDAEGLTTCWAMIVFSGKDRRREPGSSLTSFEALGDDRVIPVALPSECDYPAGPVR